VPELWRGRLRRREDLLEVRGHARGRLVEHAAAVVATERVVELAYGNATGTVWPEYGPIPITMNVFPTPAGFTVPMSIEIW
jgi:hypothetical protein